MAYVIAKPCIDHSDQACVAACPMDCITADLTIDRKLYIDPGACVDCGACARACPNGAIYPVDRLPSEWFGFAWVDAAWYRDPEAAREVVDGYPTAA